MDLKLDLLIEFFSSLRGRLVWGVIAGSGGGSHVSLKLGEKLPFTRPLKNPTLTEDERRFDGEFWLYVEGATWRLESMSIESNNSIFSEVERADTYSNLMRMRGQHIADTVLHSPSLSVDLILSNNMRFKIICNQAFGDDNYSVGGVNRKSITIAAHGRLLSQ